MYYQKPTPQTPAYREQTVNISSGLLSWGSSNGAIKNLVGFMLPC